MKTCPLRKSKSLVLAPSCNQIGLLIGLVEFVNGEFLEIQNPLKP